MHQIGISLGDPAGIGPEVVARALADRPNLDVIVYGDRRVLDAAAATAGVRPVPPHQIVAVTALGPDDVVAGRPNDVSGQAQLDYLNAATDAALAGDIAALVTAPISKSWIARAGFTFPGHTEYLAARAGVADYAMMLAGPQLRVTVATTHIALRDVAAALTPEQIATAIVLTAAALHDAFGIDHPRVAVAGLNPHAGEEGRFGDEEARLVIPALALAQARLAVRRLSADVSGPHVPDAVFRQAALGRFDAVVALYHDQGLIPVKLLHFDDAVNFTLGLPFVRTSPDHGTAYDIAGRGQARADSFLAALDLAARLTAGTPSA
ncbi:MAG: 4-hydroxythreonine-4-phosphate dehydrogenase [Myxococcales bacterium]|nr:4-hydroxythreonine-4-phosphate dehydrogenase [Myxococcales bacterium]